MWTIGQQDGPNHLGLWVLNQARQKDSAANGGALALGAALAGFMGHKQRWMLALNGPVPIGVVMIDAVAAVAVAAVGETAIETDIPLCTPVETPTEGRGGGAE